jgi:purine-nucleoside phosphorylase
LGAIHHIETLCMVTISDLIAAAEGTSQRISDEDLQRGVDKMMVVACDVAVADLT